MVSMSGVIGDYVSSKILNSSGTLAGNAREGNNNHAIPMIQTTDIGKYITDPASVKI